MLLDLTHRLKVIIHQIQQLHTSQVLNLHQIPLLQQILIYNQHHHRQQLHHTIAMTQDVCAVGASAGIQTFGVGLSGGKHFIDKNCERLKLARILNDFGMKVAAVAILCQDERVFESMIQAGTPCPIDGKIGKNALALWNKYDFERPDYKAYVKRMKKREEIEPKPEPEIIPQDASTDKKVKWTSQ